MNNPRPALADQLYDLRNNEQREQLVNDYMRELKDIENMKRDGTITAAEYVARKEAVGQAAETAIYELWRKEAAHE